MKLLTLFYLRAEGCDGDIVLKRFGASLAGFLLLVCFFTSDFRGDAFASEDCFTGFLVGVLTVAVRLRDGFASVFFMVLVGDGGTGFFLGEDFDALRLVAAEALVLAGSRVSTLKAWRSTCSLLLSRCKTISRKVFLVTLSLSYFVADACMSRCLFALVWNFQKTRACFLKICNLCLMRDCS